MTYGGGGHTHALLSKEPSVHVYTLDRDPDAHNIAKQQAQKLYVKDRLLVKITQKFMITLV
jgi:16S rRNA C1402 N4-methylase RsmH